METYRCLDALREIGVKNGDILDVSSDMLSIMLYCRRKELSFDMDVIIDDLKTAVGNDGTVLIKSFNWDFCKGKTFDIRTTPSQSGSLGNQAMKRSDFKRTHHPLYSWMVWGSRMAELCSMENHNSFGEESVFDFLYKKSAKLLNLGKTEVTGFSYTHHAESLAKVPYRFEKVFKAGYIDESGLETQREYSMFVRYLDFDIYSDICFPDVMNELEEKSVVTTYTPEGMFYRAISVKGALDFFADDLKHNYGRRVCRINGEKGFEKYIDYEFKMK